MLFNTKYLLWLSCVQCVSSLLVSYTSVVEIQQGQLKGFRGLNGQNQFYGIPYAASERFQPPQTPKKWSGVFYAISQFDSCAQAISSVHLGTEDCLKLDVYTPANAKPGQKLPVLVFFHGGAYFTGTKWQSDPEFLVNKDVIVVIPNYRLGILGFLCLNNVTNLGLKDHVAALKWIQKNIAAFGGDPDNVTISGQSAGGASASMLLMSKKTTGLFHKAILMSGVALAPWAFNLNYLTPLYEDVNKIREVRNEIDIYNTLLNATLDELLSATSDTLINSKYFKYAPCDDSDFTDPFFHDKPYNIIKSGDFNKVPMIIGYTDLEGVLLYSFNNLRTLQELDENFTKRLPSPFSWCSDKDKKIIADQIRKHYFGNQKLNSKASIKGAIDMYSDFTAYASSNAFAKLMAKYSDKPVYKYLFTYEGGRNFVKTLLDPGFGLKGAVHNDDLMYLFKPAGLSLQVNSEDQLMIDRYTTLLTDFMKYGDPTPRESALVGVRWPATTANRSQVMRIDNPLSVSDTPPHVKGDFYLQLLCRYGLSGYVPCDSLMQCNLDT